MRITSQNAGVRRGRVPAGSATRLLAVWLSLLLPLAAAQACECMDEPLDDAGVAAASDIFVFRLVSASAAEPFRKNGYDASVVGTLQIAAQLRGAAAPQTLRYQTSLCCGLRLNVGDYYAAFLRDVDGDTFGGSIGNLVPLGQGYSGSVRERVTDLAAGRITLDEAVPARMRDEMATLPPRPPPPCQSAFPAGE